jgi:membrane protease YdiL (CAAX protease family)
MRADDDAPLSSGTVVQVVAPLGALGVLLLVLRLRGRRLREELALWWPEPSRLVLWAAAFLVLVWVEHLLEGAFGLPLARPWGVRYGGLERLLRVLGIAVIAPVTEELIFRGALFTQLGRTALKAPGAVVVTAALFAALHVQYGMPELLFIVADGLFYGVARARTGTTVVPLVCHMLGNGYAALERLLP